MRPPRRWPSLELEACWRYREVLIALAVRDVKLRYKQTLLGTIWVVLQPLLAALVFAFVFGRIANLPSEGVPYAIFAFAGLLGWNLFSTTSVQAANSLVANEQLVSKVFFPRLLIPLSVAPAALIDMAVSALVLAALLGIFGITPHAGMLLVPVFAALLLALSLGMGCLAAVVAARYRDVQRLMPLFVQLLLYVSPVAYGLAAVRESVGETGQRIFMANPLAPLLEGLRWSVVGVGELAPGALLYATAFALGTFLVGALSFQAMQRGIADVL